MLFFDNINFLNIEYFFNLIYKIVFNLPEYIFFALFWWIDIISGANFWVRLFFWFATVLFGGITFYSLFRIWEINKKEWEKYLGLFVVLDREKDEKKRVDQRWVDILGHLESPNAANWTLAIIECDKILDELLRERGYEGENIGERLKTIKPGRMRSLNEAWEAHKIRNKIAHESGYILEKHEARKAVSQYEAVFRELGFLS